MLKETPAGVAPGKQLELYLKDQLYDYLDRRLAALNNISSRADCRQWQKERRDFFVQQLGGFPDRTPLKAKVARSRSRVTARSG